MAHDYVDEFEIKKEMGWGGRWWERGGRGRKKKSKMIGVVEKNTYW